jgi:hypothetical protein
MYMRIDADDSYRVTIEFGRGPMSTRHARACSVTNLFSILYACAASRRHAHSHASAIAQMTAPTLSHTVPRMSSRPARFTYASIFRLDIHEISASPPVRRQSDWPLDVRLIILILFRYAATSASPPLIPVAEARFMMMRGAEMSCRQRRCRTMHSLYRWHAPHFSKMPASPKAHLSLSHSAL